VKTAHKILMLAVVILTTHAVAQEAVDERVIEEERRQKVFQDGMAAIVSDFNRGSFAGLVAAIDREAMLEEIFGLRLIDQRMKRDFRERMQEEGNFEGFIQSQYQLEAEDGIKARLLTVESRGVRGRAVVRFDMSHFRANYIEYELQLDDKERLRVTDWTDYYWGHVFTEHMGLKMIQAQPNPNAARKLIDFPNVREAQVFQIMEVLKATRDYNFQRYFEIIDTMDSEMKRQRVVMKLGLDATREARKRREQRRVLEAIAQYHPNDLLFSLPLLDYYFPTRKYEEALDALQRVQAKLRVNDGVTLARQSSAHLVLGNIDNALTVAEESVAAEPDLELGWWAVFRARVAAGDFAAAAQVLDTLTSDFGHSLGPDTLGKDKTMSEFVRSPEYRDWNASQGD
jgi:hypothetical protein